MSLLCEQDKVRQNCLNELFVALVLRVLRATIDAKIFPVFGKVV